MTQVYLAAAGLVSSLGSNLQAALANLHKPPPPQMREMPGAEQPVPYFAIPYHEVDWHKRCTTLVQQAVAECGVVDKRGGLYLASSSCHVGAIESGQPYPVNINAFLDEIARMIDWQGPVFLINSACTSSLNAILAAQTAIVAGLFDEAVVLGLELENQLTIAGFAGMQLLAPVMPKPFQIKRDGLVLGEAVAALHLTRQTSRWRIIAGVQVLDSTQASGASVAAYMAMLQKALALAALVPEQIDIVKVQAAGSPVNDAVEAEALTRLFKIMPALITFKSLIGHTLGAAGAAEMALLLTLLEQQQWPQLSLNEAEYDAALAVNFAPRLPSGRFMLACNLGFGGSHTCIALEDCHAS